MRWSVPWFVFFASASILLPGCPKAGLDLLAESDLQKGPILSIVVGPPTSADRTLRFRTPHYSGEELVFVDLHQAPGRTRPGVIHPGDGGHERQELVFIDEELRDHTWVFVGRIGRTRGLIGLLDRRGKVPAGRLIVATSPDGGRRWYRRGVVQKVHPRAVFERFVMDATGRGKVICRLGHGPEVTQPPGRFVHRTENAGLTFSAPERL